MKLEKIQESLRAKGMDGWLFCDFHHRDPVGCRILGLPVDKFTSRRWFYFVPAVGAPRKLVHSVEKGKLDALPGERVVYLPWEQLHAELRILLGDAGRVAMQYSPMNNIPYNDLADPGIVELVRSFGVEVVGSADLVQEFEAVLGEDGWTRHLEASVIVQEIKDRAFERIREAVRKGETLTEYDVQQEIIRGFTENGLNCDGEWPIVAVNGHAADPHFEPTPENTVAIQAGDKVLIDLWARRDLPDGIYYDITWCGYVGAEPPRKYVEIWEAAIEARNAALNLVKARLGAGETIFGWEVDKAARDVVEARGYGPYFVHRTGHSIGTAVHGNGVHMDNLETRDDRELVPGICFSLEPGIYLEGEMGVRTEIDVFIKPDGTVVVAGEIQKDLLLL
ncbi:MAG: M24 family metallopeptidase [Pseudomonadota bacterium]